VWKSLETDVYTTAKLRLPDKMDEEQRLIAAGLVADLDWETVDVVRWLLDSMNHLVGGQGLFGPD
jgi:hypothetical protein